ncbi:putative membrane protein [Paenibacillus cellulosilyticus]|uniref:Putative membrane protein n=1 Tax=Paenibacillus cellulosilyticus TaxID=375489 RepID=A0A2V2YU92_9BACL|nr:putative membrane protein [Paenibacillus cellulosilyticus]
MALTIQGSVVERAHASFTTHMVQHLLFGMLAPLLIVIASPFTLALRAMSVHHARRCVRLTKHPYMHVVMHPLTAVTLNIGGLWALYATRLYSMMHESAAIYVLVHLHLFAAGYLFTASILSLDLVYRRFGFAYRAIMLIVAIAGHSILSKYIYGSPPGHVPSQQAEAGAMLMYYGGDAIELIVIVLLCFQWYKTRLIKDQSSVL